MTLQQEVEEFQRALRAVGDEFSRTPVWRFVERLGMWLARRYSAEVKDPD